MNISIIQRVREASSDERFTILAEEICEDDVDDDSIHIIVVQKALHQMEKVYFYVKADLNIYFTPVKNVPFAVKSGNVVVSDTDDGRIIRKNGQGRGYLVYDFLKDYLGLSDKTPFSVASMSEKYSDFVPAEENALIGQSYCDMIALSLLRKVRSVIYNPLATSNTVE